MLTINKPSKAWETRRGFLRKAGAAALLPLAGCGRGERTAPGASAPEPSSPPSGGGRFATVSVFHTTDLHGNILPTTTYEGVSGLGGLARCATQIRRWRKEHPDHLVLDIGDVYQGTHVSFSDGGELMIDLLNRLNYDGWVVGNHEFDWGADAFFGAVANSKMPVLSANLLHGEAQVGAALDVAHPFARIAPSILRQVGDFKIGVVGITTPGLPAWLRPELLEGIGASDPVEPVRAAVGQLLDAGADCILGAGHMGLKRGRDDYANPVREILSEVPEINAYIAGHTHQDEPFYVYRDTLFTQAGYWGMFAGKLDITFDRETRQVIDTRGNTVLMDDRFEFDPVVMSVASDKLEVSAKELGTVVGELGETLGYDSIPGVPAGSHLLIGAALEDALGRAGTAVDGVLHGTFCECEIPAGPKTLADIWEMVPYENMLVTGELSGDDLRAVLEEAINVSWLDRQLIGFDYEVGGERHGEYKLGSLRDPSGEPVQPDKKYRIAFNSYDSQSGGRRMTLLRDLLGKAENRSVMHRIDSRSAVVEFFAEHEAITPQLLAKVLAG